NGERAGAGVRGENLKNAPLWMIAGVWLLFVAGCSRETPPAPAGLAVEQVPLTFNQAFAEAAPEIKQVAQDVVTAVQGDDAPKAFVDLQHLNSQSTLTGPQREAALRAMVTMHERLRAAADKGDKKAQETLEQYGASK